MSTPPPCGTKPHTPQTPALHDLLILHTAVYDQLCAHLGRFVDHYPNPQDPSGAPDPIARTIQSTERAGFTVDRHLWDEPTPARAGVR